MEDIKTISDLETLQLVFDPFRMRLISLFSDRPRTVKEVADELETTPHRLYYHVRKLEAAGLLEVADTRLVSGIVEKHYLVAARQFVVDRALLDFRTEEGVQGFEQMLRDVLDRTREDIMHSGQAGLINPESTAPEPDSLFIRRGYVRLSRAQAREVYTRLQALLADMLAEDDTAEDERGLYAIQMALYPAQYRIEEDDDGLDDQ